jgi:hypothetical protein
VVWHSGWWPQAYSALYLKVPARRATLILLANSEGLRWDNPLHGAEVERSLFTAAFLEFLGTAVQVNQRRAQQVIRAEREWRGSHRELAAFAVVCAAAQFQR